MFKQPLDHDHKQSRDFCDGRRAKRCHCDIAEVGYPEPVEEIESNCCDVPYRKYTQENIRGEVSQALEAVRNRELLREDRKLDNVLNFNGLSRDRPG